MGVSGHYQANQHMQAVFNMVENGAIISIDYMTQI